mmetsp:Transcript_9002/g.18132  ORF Transcript_9002/g.18132 Transcript_9002/m.18132 type:complete len:116 (-) Transcript_9002:178-525(-)
MEALYQKYNSKGFQVFGFPCNQFASEEPEAEPAIKAFCTKNYGVTFPMFSKIEVNGPGSHPIYKFLKGSNEAAGTAEIDWNFHKILVGRDGKVVQRYAAATEPAALEKDIENLLG